MSKTITTKLAQQTASAEQPNKLAQQTASAELPEKLAQQWMQRLVSLVTGLNIALQQIMPTCNPLWEKENSKRVETILTTHYNHCYTVLHDNKTLLLDSVACRDKTGGEQLELMNHWKLVENEMVVLFKHFYRPRLHEKLEHYNWNGLIHNAAFRTHFLQYFRDLHLNSHPLEQLEVLDRMQKNNPQFFYHLLPYMVSFPSVTASTALFVMKEEEKLEEQVKKNTVDVFYRMVVQFFQNSSNSVLASLNAKATYIPFDTVRQIWIHQYLPLVEAAPADALDRYAQYMQVQHLLMNTAVTLISPWCEFLPKLLQASILKTCQSLLVFDQSGQYTKQTNELLLLQHWLCLRIFKRDLNASDASVLNSFGSMDTDEQRSKCFILLYNDYVQDPNAYLTMFALCYKLCYWRTQ